MQKYKRPTKAPGIRSIPLANPRKVIWPQNWTPNKDKYISYDTRSPGCKIINQPAQQPKFVLMHHLDMYRELRMYWLGRTYWFTEFNLITKRNWRSTNYNGREQAMSYYELEMAGRYVIRWKEVSAGES